MDVLTICQRAAPWMGISVPDAVFGSSQREHVELAAIVNEAAGDIAEAHDWQLLKRLCTYAGDGATEAFDAPTDYGWMPKDQRIWSSEQEAPMTHVLSHDDWLELEVKSYDLVVRAWTLIGGQFAFKPTMAVGETAKLYYQSNLYAYGISAGNKAEFTADTDTFRLSDRLLKLAIIWRWRASKSLDYAEDVTNYGIELARVIDRDRGAKMLAIGRGRHPRGVDIAYPQAIAP